MVITHSINHTKTSQEDRIKEFSLTSKTKLNKARLKLISMMILVLCKIKTVNYMALASVFDGKANPESSMRRIQRFMGDFDLPMKLISCFIFGILPEKRTLFWY
jgi:hypothetical protein